MAKINQEEYEILKGLDDKWKWIARDGFTGIVNVYEDNPRKIGLIKEWTPTGDRANRTIFNKANFQFIQWEDDEPYNIAELIEEYENNYKGSWEHVIEFSKEVFEESEEKEVKDIEWLKSWFSNETLYKGKYINNKIDQLELEVLSPEWIGEHSYNIEEYWQAADMMDGTQYAVSVENLQNLLVPKLEKVDKAYKEGYDIGKEHGYEKGYSVGVSNNTHKPEFTIYDAHDKIREESTLTDKSFDYYWNCIADGVEIDEPGNLLVPRQEEVDPDEARFNRKVNKIIKAIENPKRLKLRDVVEKMESLSEVNQKQWLDRLNEKFGEIEQEPKYYIQITKYDFMVMDDNGFIYPENLNPHNYKSEFTEQEIKDYDPRYWAFAEPVEEVEE